MSNEKFEWLKNELKKCVDIINIVIYLLSVRIRFAELKQDSEGTVETGTTNMSRAIIDKVGKRFMFFFQ